MKKKILVTMFALTMTAAMLTACGKQENVSKGTNDVNVENESTTDANVKIDSADVADAEADSTQGTNMIELAVGESIADLDGIEHTIVDANDMSAWYVGAAFYKDDQYYVIEDETDYDFMIGRLFESETLLKEGETICGPDGVEHKLANYEDMSGWENGNVIWESGHYLICEDHGGNGWGMPRLFEPEYIKKDVQEPTTTESYLNDTKIKVRTVPGCNPSYYYDGVKFIITDSYVTEFVPAGFKGGEVFSEEECINVYVDWAKSRLSEDDDQVSYEKLTSVGNYNIYLVTTSVRNGDYKSYDAIIPIAPFEVTDYSENGNPTYHSWIYATYHYETNYNDESQNEDPTDVEYITNLFKTEVLQ